MRSSMMLGYMKREPAYVLWLSAILKLTGTLSPPVLCLFQTALSLLSCLLLYRHGVQIFDVWTGRVASLIYAVHPISFWYSNRFASEVLTVPVVLLCLLAVVRFFSSPTRTRAAQLGLSLGFAVLTKSACVVLLPVVLGFGLVKWRRQLRSFLFHAAFILIFYACIHSLWVIRNYLLCGEIVPFTTMAGAQFFVGNETVTAFDRRRHTAGEWPDQATDALYLAVQSEIAAGAPQMSLPRLEAETDRQLVVMARRQIRQKPSFIARKCLSGLYFIWFLSNTSAKSFGWLLFQGPLVAIAVIGRCRKRDWDPNHRLLLCIVLAYIAPYTFLLALARYAMPIMPIVFLFASDAVVSGLTARFRRQVSEVGTPGREVGVPAAHVQMVGLYRPV
jgi:4-amino-4-deoxy-L-arabinose transferase-like glycosyltransferase